MRVCEIPSCRIKWQRVSLTLNVWSEIGVGLDVYFVRNSAVLSFLGVLGSVLDTLDFWYNRCWVCMTLLFLWLFLFEMEIGALVFSFTALELAFHFSIDISRPGLPGRTSSILAHKLEFILVPR